MNKRHWTILAAAALALILLPQLRAQQDQSQSPAPPASGMKGMNMSEMQRDTAASPQAAQAANEDMSDMRMDMGPHMRMTNLRPENATDEQRAAQVLAELRPAIEKYKDYHVALDDGFKIFGPNVPQPRYHFTSWRYAMEAQFTFNPEHPTSLLYKKVGDGYELEGAMYTAPQRDTEDQLNARIPLSVARWHQHVNLCLPPRGESLKQANWSQFGLRGSIATEDACDTAGGRWHAVIFNWMVHVYPYETDPAKIWAH
ncbi:MAG: hypothetical protein WA002_06580 [Candidatus Acidiferrales bacterium]